MSTGNPVRYNDPSGHMVDDGCKTEGCELSSLEDYVQYSRYTIEARFKSAIHNKGISQRSRADKFYSLDNPITRATYFTWAANNVAKGSPNVKLALADLMHVSLSNFSTGLMAASMGGDLTPVVGSGNAYSVAYETNLPQSVFQNTRSSHNYHANRALLEDMNSNPQFAQAMEELIPNLGKQLYFRPNASPKGWTWHHVADQSGVMQLIPRIQHVSPLLQNLLHPGGQGGFSLWQ